MAAEVQIETMGADGDGIGALPDGARVYVPFTVPGDRVLVQPNARRGEGWAAQIETLLAPGPGRRAPFCGHFGVCGGCVVQHWDDADYVAWKTGRLTAALLRAGYTDPPIAPMVRGAAGVRRRLDLAVRRVPGGVSLGLHRAHAGEIVDLTECPVSHPDLSGLISSRQRHDSVDDQNGARPASISGEGSLIGPLRKVLATLAAIRRDASVVVNLLDSGPDILLRTDADLITPDRAKLTDFAHAHGVPRISWAFGEGLTEAVCVLTPPVIAFSGVAVTPPAGAFLQASREGEDAIIAAVLDGLPAKQTAKSRAVDLFAGCGTISFALAQRIRVLALEGDPDLTAAGHAAVNKAGLMGKVEFRQRDLARQPLQAKELAAFSVVVLDPPHAGAAAQMPLIAASKAGTVIYVSCDPVSLGRDASVLRAAGYRLVKVTPIDQFPWSARLEAVAVFRLGK